MATLEHRIDAADLSPQEKAELPRLLQSLQASGHAVLTTPQNQHIALPAPVYHLLVQVLSAMKQGRALTMMPEDEAFTTQAAADQLGMSRQHLVTLLEKGEIPFHRVGKHRRIRLKDLIAYEQARAKDRRGRLDALFGQLKSEGLYDNDPA
jgi:excisionase family DNA binding protein